MLLCKKQTQKISCYLDEKTTESISKYDHLEKMETNELLVNINQEDKSVADLYELFLTLKTLLIAF